VQTNEKSAEGKSELKDIITQWLMRRAGVLTPLAVAVLVASACGSVPAQIPTPTGEIMQATVTPTPMETAMAATKSATILAAEPKPKATQTKLSAQPPTATVHALDHPALLDDVLYGRTSPAEAKAILERIGSSGDTQFVVGLIDTMRYRGGLREDVNRALNSLTGQDLPPDWFDWVEWAGQHPEIQSFSEYPGWKAKLYSNIDVNFLRFLYPGVKVAPGSRVEEIVWGGVRVDGIPALDYPKMIDPSEADYLVPHERVFGVSINGDTRAYPARFLDWHEMFNDVVGGEPVSLAY
jgi:hypothetical protein